MGYGDIVLNKKFKMISLDKIAKKNRAANRIFKVPKNYFDELPLSINQRIEIQIEEEPQLNTINKNAFKMPEDYFDKLSAKIINRIEQIDNKKINIEALERVNIFKVPNNYFQNLEQISAIESFDKVNVFKVPNGYFETLLERILSKTEQKETKVIKVNWFSKNIKWAAAASIVLMVGLWFSLPNFTKNKTELALEQVSKEDIKSYLENQDISYLVYETVEKNTENQVIDTQILDGLKLNKQDILDHLANQDIETDI